jgi:hypothetical protein
LQHISQEGRKYVGYGPPEGVRYGDLTIYSFEYCLERGESYLLGVEDNFGDGMWLLLLCFLGLLCTWLKYIASTLTCCVHAFTGMCCDRGYGGYEFSLGNTLMYSSDFEKTFNDYVEHTFTVGEIYTRMPTRLPTSKPTKAETNSPTIKVEIGDPTVSPITP